jgi:hypothetical protein
VPDSYRITGRIRDEENGPVKGFTVHAFDKELGIYLHPDDRLGKATTADDGSFEILFGKDTFKDWLESNPKVYLVVRDRGGIVALQTEAETNTTGVIEFQIKLGEIKVDPLSPNIYQDGLRRIAASFRGMGAVVDLSKGDVKEMSEVLFRAVDSYALYRDQLIRATGYDGIQVPAEPRKEHHDHVSRWDKPVLPV